jgi:hypothetical protein
MRRRLYFLLPDVVSARRTAADLLLARVEHRHMHVLAKRGTDLAELHEANPLQKTDFVHGAERGIVIGGIGGIALGVLAVLAPPGGAALQWITVLATGIGGALIGAWIGSLAGTGAPNSRLKRYDGEFEAGKVLLMVDVPFARVDEIRNLVHRQHPEASGGTVEPTMPAFP